MPPPAADTGRTLGLLLSPLMQFEGSLVAGLPARQHRGDLARSGALKLQISGGIGIAHDPPDCIRPKVATRQQLDDARRAIGDLTVAVSPAARMRLSP